VQVVERNPADRGFVPQPKRRVAEQTLPVTARVPDDANTLVFGIFLSGRGRIEMRNTELAAQS
jgi:hypothetical protein